MAMKRRKPGLAAKLLGRVKPLHRVRPLSSIRVAQETVHSDQVSSRAQALSDEPVRIRATSPEELVNSLLTRVSGGEHMRRAAALMNLESASDEDIVQELSGPPVDPALQTFATGAEQFIMAKEEARL